MKMFLKVFFWGGGGKWKPFDFLRWNMYLHIKRMKSRTYSA